MMLVVKNLPTNASAGAIETRGWSLGQADLMEKEMATHPRILAWEILWTEELGELQSMGLQKSWACLRD